MVDVYKKIRGIIDDLFQFDKGSGPQLKNNSGVIELKNSDDSDYAVGRTAGIPDSGETVNDTPDLLDLKGRVADISFSFAGASVPSAGTNTGEFGFCHTAGGIYSAGDIIYDDGTSLIVIPTTVATNITTRDAVSGTISLVADGSYTNQDGTWTLKGDGSGGIGVVHVILITYDFNDTTLSSTDIIPDGAYVTNVRNVVTTAFNGTAPTITAVVDGTADETILSATDSDLTEVNEYHIDETSAITSSTEGVVTITVTPDSSTVGSGFILVSYDLPAL